MKKFAIVMICVALALCTLVSFASCDQKEQKTYDLELRENTPYGLYWYGDSGELDDKVKSAKNLSVEYYDPSKPTVIYSHGWKPDGDDREELQTLEKTYSKTKGASGNYNYVKELKQLGYNVAMFDWYDYAKQLSYLHDEIWTVQSIQDLDEKQAQSNYGEAVKVLDGRSFAGEFARSVLAVMKQAQDKEVVFIGHSFGAQMVTSASYILYKLSEENDAINKNILPSRIVLADPYITGAEMKGKLDIIGDDLSGITVAAQDATAFRYMSERGAAIDIYGAMTMWTCDMYKNMITDKDEVKRIESQIVANTAFVVQKGLRNAYGTVGDIHNVSRDWVLTAYVEGKKGNLTGCSPNPSMTAQEMKAYVGYKYDQLYDGFDPSKTTMQRQEQ